MLLIKNLRVPWSTLIKADFDERILTVHSQKRSTKYNINNDYNNDKNVNINSSNSYNRNNDNNNSRDRSNLNGTKNGQIDICIEIKVLLRVKMEKNVNDNNKSVSKETLKRIRTKIGFIRVRPLESSRCKNNLLCLSW